MQDPYLINKCGHTFQKEAIFDWVKKAEKCPLCNTVCDLNDLLPNYTLKDVVKEIQDKKI